MSIDPSPRPLLRRRALRAVLGVLGLCALNVAAVSLPLPAEAQGVPEAAVPVQALDQALLQSMRQGSAGAPFASRYQALRPVVARVFNLPLVLQEVVGLGWANMPADQRQRLLAAFSAFTVATYVANFDGYDGQSFAISPQTRAVGAEVVVSTRFVPATGKATRLDYVMQRGADGWQATDVLLDGTISRAATQRADFQSVLAGGTGGDALIASLTQKVNALSGGTVRP